MRILQSKIWGRARGRWEDNRRVVTARRALQGPRTSVSYDVALGLASPYPAAVAIGGYLRVRYFSHGTRFALMRKPLSPLTNHLPPVQRGRRGLPSTGPYWPTLMFRVLPPVIVTRLSKIVSSWPSGGRE